MRNTITSASCSAPGKLILCGEHAVVYGKEAVACAVSLRTTCDVRMHRASEQLKVMSVPSSDDAAALTAGILANKSINLRFKIIVFSQIALFVHPIIVSPNPTMIQSTAT